MLAEGSVATARRWKAPVVLLSFRSVLLVVFVASLLTALTAAASPFVSTAAGSEALRNRLAELTPLATGLQIEAPLQLQRGTPAGLARLASASEADAKRLAATLGEVGAPILTAESSPLYSLGSASNPVRLLARSGALAHVKVIAHTSGPGVWISNITAELGRLKPGGKLRFASGRPGGSGIVLRVKGIYRALSRSPQSAYWVNLFQDIYPLDPNDPPPPSYLLLGLDDFYRVVLATGGGGFRYGNDGGFGTGSGVPMTMLEFPVDPKGLTLGRARALEQRFDAASRALPATALGRELGCGGPFTNPCTTGVGLAPAVLLADQNVEAVKVPVTLLADAGAAIALAVAAAAGLFSVRRRRAEVALAYARGEHVASFAARTAVEAFLPALLGGAAGFGLAYGLTGVFAPSGSTDHATVDAGALDATVAVVVALALLVGAASFAFLRLYDTGARPLPWLRWLPWELPLLAVAIYLLVRITSGGGLSGSASSGAAHPTLAVFVFPLLLVAAVAGLLSRAARLGLALGSGWVARVRRVAIYLALRRLAAARGLLVVLAVVTAVALGAFCYAESLASSLAHTTTEKAYIATGSDAEASIAPEQQLPKRFPYPLTKVEFANQNASLDAADGTQVDVMLVDPATVVGAIHWQGDWGPDPGRLLHELAAAPDQPLPVIVTEDAASMHVLWASGTRFPVRVIGVVKAFPEMAAGIPLVVTSYRAFAEESARLRSDDPLGVLQAYVWGKGPPAAVERAIISSPLNAYFPSSIDTFLRDPNVLLATRTYSFMRTIALAAAVLVLLGLLLYLQARQRSQVIASALARRMGFGAGSEALSVSLEVFAILAFAALVGGGIAIAAAGPVVRHIDPLPLDAPAPIFALPLGALVTAAGGLLGVAALAGALTTWRGRRAIVSEELRVA